MQWIFVNASQQYILQFTLRKDYYICSAWVKFFRLCVLLCVAWFVKKTAWALTDLSSSQLSWLLSRIPDTHTHTLRAPEKRWCACFIDPSTSHAACEAIKLICDSAIHQHWIIRAFLCSFLVSPVPHWPCCTASADSAFAFSPETFHVQLAAVYIKARANFFKIDDLWFRTGI